MRLAIMQPYFLPYIGYFQLMAAVDKFVLLDDVNYINRGWINRNRILVNGTPRWMTIPLVGASQNRLICDIDVQPGREWRRKMLRTAETVYRKASFFPQAFAVLKEILVPDTTNLSAFLFRSIRLICEYLRIDTIVEPTSSIYDARHFKGQQRIMQICVQENADTYVNPPGGRELYDAEPFSEQGIELRFIQPRLSKLELRHSGNEGPVLSVLDLMMLNPASDITEALQVCTLE